MIASTTTMSGGGIRRRVSPPERPKARIAVRTLLKTPGTDPCNRLSLSVHVLPQLHHAHPCQHLADRINHRIHLIVMQVAVVSRECLAFRHEVVRERRVL